MSGRERHSTASASMRSETRTCPPVDSRQCTLTTAAETLNVSCRCCCQRHIVMNLMYHREKVLVNVAQTLLIPPLIGLAISRRLLHRVQKFAKTVFVRENKYNAYVCGLANNARVQFSFFLLCSLISLACIALAYWHGVLTTAEKP